MSDRIISSEEGDLLLHRFVTERIPMVAWFLSADKSVSVKLTGFITGSKPPAGMFLSTVWPTTSADSLGGPPTYMNLKAIAGSVCTYADETELPKDFVFGSTLKLRLPNGDTLFIMEKRSERKLT